MKIYKSLFERAKVLGASEQLIEERYYKKPFDEMEFHQQIRCLTEADRALAISRKILNHYKILISKEKNDSIE